MFMYMSSVNGQKTYYRKAKDALVWAKFEKVAARLNLSVSEAMKRAAEEWSVKHEGDSPEDQPAERAPSSRHKVLDYDPFEVFKDAPKVKVRDPFA